MVFFRKSGKADYKFLDAFSYYVPGVGGVLAVLGLFLLGALLGGMVDLSLPDQWSFEYRQVIEYPIMFIPAMIFVRSSGMRNYLFEGGYAIDSRHFGNSPAALTIILALLSTVAAGLVSDGLNEALLPPVPAWLEVIFSRLTGGNILMNFIAVSIMAPVCEEWMLRGVMLRGLLYCKRKNGRRGFHPAVAIGITAVIFGLIHANPWQALPAVVAGVLFGYVYYKTGSLWLTIGMHSLNNTLSLLMGQIEGFENAKGWTDILPAGGYALTFIAAILIIIWTVKHLAAIPSSPQGNCDEIKIS